MYKYLQLYKDITKRFTDSKSSIFFFSSKIPTLSNFLFFVHREKLLQVERPLYHIDFVPK